jgi:glutathione S-transferase
MQDQLTLYSYWRSSASWRIRIVLALKDIKYTLVPISLIAGEHLAPEYLAVNPTGALPALKLIDGTVIPQSLAIFQYIESTHPSPCLVPLSPLLMAKV